MIKKVYSKRLKKNVWAFQITVDGYPLRRSGFATKREAEEAEEALRQQSRAIRHSRDVRMITENMLMSKVIEQFIADRIAPLRRDLERIEEEKRRLREENRRLRGEADGSTLLDLSDASRRTGIPESRLKAAIKLGLLPATRVGHRTKVLRRDLLQYVRSTFNSGRVPASPEAAEAARHKELRTAIKECGPRIVQAKRLARLHLSGRWREVVREEFPELHPEVIEMLPNEKPSVLAYEQVGRQQLGVSGRQLLRILSKRP